VGIYSTIDYLRSLGMRDGRERGVRGGAAGQLGRLLLRHGRRRFGPPAQAQQRLVDVLVERAGLSILEQARDRFLNVPGWTELLAGLEVPLERPADPYYVKPFEIDPEPPAPSIDEYARVSTKSSGDPSIIHIRFQRVYQPNLGEILYKDSKRVQAERKCPVTSVVILMWPGADGPAITGTYAIPSGGTYTYTVTRLWERDVEEMFGSVATAVYAPLSKFAPECLPEIIRRMDDYIEANATDEKMRSALWVVVYSSMGLRYSAEQANQLLASQLPYILEREECRSTMSEGFHAGYSEGEQEGAIQALRGWVEALGSQRLGAPPPLVAQALTANTSRDRLEQLAARVLKGANWQEVLAPS
jgi:hypothetical protein